MYKIVLTGHTENTATHYIFKELDKSYLETTSYKEWVIFPIVGPAFLELHFDEQYLTYFKKFISNNNREMWLEGVITYSSGKNNFNDRYIFKSDNKTSYIKLILSDRQFKLFQTEINNIKTNIEEQKICNCDIMMIMQRGCQCGGT